jgi:hypothetical protein
MRPKDISIPILQEKALAALKDTDRSPGKACRMFAGTDPLAPCFNTDHSDVVIDKGVKEAD